MKPIKPFLAGALALGILGATPMPAFAIYTIPPGGDPPPDPGFMGCQSAGECTPPAPPPVPPSVVSSDTSYFEGVCSDCTGVGAAILVLQNYTLGDQLTNANFAGFSYQSDLTSYTISSLDALSGSLGGAAGEYDLNLEGLGNSDFGPVTYFFTAATDGAGVRAWSTGTTEPPSTMDMGVGYTFTTVSDAPEPSTWAMMIAGLGVAGAALRWRRRTDAPLASGREGLTG